MLHVKLAGMKQRTQCKLIFSPFNSQMGQKVETFYFLKKVMLHIKLKRKKCKTLCKFDLMHNPGLLGWVKRWDIEILQISIF